MRRIVTAIGIVVISGVALAPTAGADPAEPGNYESTVLRTTPPTTAITAKVVGGDGFLDLRVEPGHTVDIPGYQGEPWLRIDADGTVERNEASAATYLNETRYGGDIPDGVTREEATKNPRWVTMGHDGRYVWHDHRIHYMNQKNPPTLMDGTNRVVISDRDDGLWYVPVTVDGADHEIIGELLLLEAPNPLPQWVLAAATLALLTIAGFVLRGPASRVAAVALVVSGGLALWAGASELAAVPEAAGGNPIWVGLPVVAVLVALAGLALRSDAARAIAVLASAAALGVWAALRVPALNKALPLGSLDPTLTRTIIALVLGTAAGSIVAAIASGGLALKLPDLDLDDDENGAGDGDESGPASEATTARE